MAKNNTSGRRPASKRKGPTTADEYFTGVREPARSRLHQMRETIRSVVPRETTEVISYKMPAFKHGGVLVWYGAFADHVSLFPGGSVLEVFKDDLADFKTSKGTVQFSLDSPLPTALIKRIVKARVQQVKVKKRR